MKQLRWILLLVFLLWGFTPAGQTGLPTYAELYVNDYANVIDDTTEEGIRTLLQQLKTEKDIEMTVLTIGRMSDYGDYSEIEPFATELFNLWGIGDPVRNDGVLLLVAVEDRQMRIELGAGYDSSYNSEMQNVIDEFMLPRFREEDFSKGIAEGVTQTIYKITGTKPTITTPTGPTTTATSYPDINQDSFLARLFVSVLTFFDQIGLLPVILGFVGIGATSFSGLTMYFRYRPRTCPDCSRPMERLQETDDDLYLDDGQKLEEFLKSVDYDIWKCSNCGQHQLLRYATWFSGYSDCPKCTYRTVQTHRVTLHPATYQSSGKERVTRDCQKCSFHDERVVTIPRKVKSRSSSGGGSFSGGRSSGGGASGRW